MTTLEESGRGAEYEIDMTGDVAVFEVLPATIQKYRVLPTQKATVSKHERDRRQLESPVPGPPDRPSFQK